MSVADPASSKAALGIVSLKMNNGGITARGMATNRKTNIVGID
jgi:hypothetical protein